MDFYMSLIIITELMMISMAIHVITYSGFTGQQKTWYLLTFFSIMICAAAEFAVHCGYYDPAFSGFLTVITVIQFTIAPMLGVFFTGALGLYKQAKIASLFFLVNAVIEIVSAPFGIIFYFNEAGYNRGDYFIVYEAFYIISLVYLIICMVIVGKKFRRRDVFTIVMILVILIAGIVPMTLFRLNVTYIAIAVSASLCYIYYNDLVQQDIKSELVANQKKMNAMQTHIISGLANLIEDRDMETGEHIFRTGEYVKKLAENARKDGVYTDKINDHFITLLYTLAPMHDIGKIVVPDSILKKPGRLTDEEYEQMKRHAAIGGAVVREVLNGITDEEYISFASDIAMYHHEKWDGSGYPEGLSGEDIPLAARIMAIADVFDALISERCYKKAMTPDKAFEVIIKESGSHFDPKLTEVFIKHKNEFLIKEDNENSVL